MFISTGGKLIGKENSKEQLLKQLKEAGLDMLYVSLNGSSENINSRSRDGYYDAIEMLDLAKKNSIDVKINWVSRHDNIDDLEKLIELAKSYNVTGIDILKNKKDFKNEIQSELDRNDLLYLANIVKENKGYLSIESCFYEVKNLLGVSFSNFWLSGCSAGKYSMAIDSCGRFMPCAHSDENFKETGYNNISDYWNYSRILENFRNKNHYISKCNDDCKFVGKCIGCMLEEECLMKL